MGEDKVKKAKLLFASGALIFSLGCYPMMTKVFAQDSESVTNLATLQGEIHQNESKTDLKVDVYLPTNLNVKQVLVPIWQADDQSDIYWYPATKVEDGHYQVTFESWRHQFHEGNFHIHVYAFNQDNTRQAIVLEDAQVHLPASSIAAEVQNYNDRLGSAEVKVNVQAPQQIRQVYVPVWHADDQSDIKWYQATRQADGTYLANINVSNHQNHRGNYHIHAYAYFEQVNKPIMTVLSDLTFNEYPDEVQAEVLNFNNKNGSFDVKVQASSTYGVKQVYVPIWSEANQGDIKWYQAEKQSDGTYLAHMNISNHKYHRNPYHIHVYAYNNQNKAKAKVLEDVRFEPFPDELSASIVRQDDEKGTLTVKVNAFSEKGIDKVYVPIWSTANQSDIKWYQAQKQSDGSYLAEMNIANHQYHRGNYHIHVYAYNRYHEAKMMVLPDTNFNVYQDSISGAIQNLDKQNGTFTVRLNVKAHQGVKSIKVPIWHRSNQSDIKWYEAKRINDSTYEVQFNVMNHNYENGTYHVHAYLTNYANKQVGTVVGDVNVAGDFQQKVLNVPYYNQNAWGAPVGCEGVALLQALQTKGYAKQYNPRTFLNEIPKSVDGTPYTGFVGSPFIANPWQFTAIFDSALTKWGNRYGRVENISGSSTAQLLDQVWQGNPVVAYVTVHMTPLAWGNWSFGRVPNNNHAVTLSGYNKHNGTVYITDPIDGKYWMSASKFASIYEARKMAVVVK